MGKHGPCYHCGVTSTPLWRNGPPEKPVLCNACGSRWRTKGTLANYTPLHARVEPDDFEDHRIKTMRSISVKNNKLETKILKRKYDNDVSEFGAVPSSSDYNQGFRKVLDEDTSNRSSSGSAISNSESCAQYGSADASDLTGPSQSIIWDTTVPSKKRTCVSRPKPSPVEKLTKDLYTIWHEQQSSCFSASSEEDLLLETDKPMVSVEFGHGSILIRHPTAIAREEESEASSLSIDNKQQAMSEAYSWKKTPVKTDEVGDNSSNRGIKNLAVQQVENEKVKRDMDRLEKLQLLVYHNSPLLDVDLQDVLNFDQFVSHLTKEEQQQLLKSLPSSDTSGAPDSLKSMFGSLQFEENLLSFQKLLAEGVFDNSFFGVKKEDCRTLKKHVLCSMTKSKWVEQYSNMLKDAKGNLPEDANNMLAAVNSESTKGSRDGQNQTCSGPRTGMKSPKRVLIKTSYEHKEPIDNNDGSCFSPKSLFSLPNDDDYDDNNNNNNDNNSFLVLDSSRCPPVENSEQQDLLLEIPSNSFFPQAELLPIASGFGGQASTSSSSVYPNNLIHP